MSSEATGVHMTVQGFFISRGNFYACSKLTTETQEQGVKYVQNMFK